MSSISKATHSATHTDDQQDRPVIIRKLGLTKSYQQSQQVTHALAGIDATIYRGELISILGPSGSGKTTFFNMIGALDSPADAGC